jgi:flagellin-specific chaperone FliS
MAGDVLGELAVKLSADSKDLINGLSQAEKSTKSFEEKFLNTSKVVGTAALGMGVAILGGLAASVKGFTATAGALTDLSDKTGVSTDLLQELGHAAKMTGADVSGIEVAFKKMQVSMVAATDGIVEAAKKSEEQTAKIKSKYETIVLNITEKTEKAKVKAKEIAQKAISRIAGDDKNRAKKILAIEQDLADELRDIEETKTDALKSALDAKKSALDENVAMTEDGAEAASKAFGKLGIDVAALRTLSPDKQFLAIADALAAVEDPAERSALAVAIFGKSGTDLLPMLKDGKAGLTAFREEAHELGLVIDKEAVAAGDKLGDSLDKLDEQFKALGNTMATQLTPVIQPIIDDLNELMKNFGQWAKDNPELAQGLTKVALALITIGTALVILKPLVESLKWFLALFAGGAAAGAGGAAGTGVLAGLAAAFVSIAASIGLAEVGLKNFSTWWGKLLFASAGPAGTIWAFLTGKGKIITPPTGTKEDLKRWWDGLWVDLKMPSLDWSSLSSGLTVVTQNIEGAWNWMKANSTITLGLVATSVTNVFNTIITPLKTAWDWLKTAASITLSGAASAALTTLGTVVTTLKDTWNWLVSNSYAYLNAGYNAALDTISTMISAIRTGWNELKNATTITLKGIADASLTTLKTAVTGVQTAWTWLTTHTSITFNAVVSAGLTALSTITEKIKSAWDWLLNTTSVNLSGNTSGLDYVNELVTSVKNAWSDLKSSVTSITFTAVNDGLSVVSSAANVLKDAWNWIVTHATVTLSANFPSISQLQTTLTGIQNSFTHLFSGIEGDLRGLLNSMINNLNNMIEWINNQVIYNIANTQIAGLYPFGFMTSYYIPFINYLAEGGIVTSPTLSMIGEAGPEAVIPLDKLGGGGVHLHFDNPIFLGDETSARKLASVVEGYLNQNKRLLYGSA